MSQRILIALSSHGYGHLGQTAPVIDALRQRRPQVRLLVRSRLPEFKLREKLGDDIEVQAAELDIGIIQKDALNIDVEATAEKYAAFHQHWEALLEREKQALRDIHPDLIIANIPYLTLAAAQRLGISNLAFCALNRAELYQHLFAARPESAPILEQMLDAYNGALCFLQPPPAMRMPGIENGVAIGRLAQLGKDVAGALRARLAIDPATALVLFSAGGMEISTPCDGWPRFPGLHLHATAMRELPGRSAGHAGRRSAASGQTRDHRTERYRGCGRHHLPLSVTAAKQARSDAPAFKNPFARR